MEEVEEEEKEKELAGLEVSEDKEDVVCPREGVSSRESSIFTLRNSQSGVKTPPSNPNTTGPELSPFSVPPPPLFTPNFFLLTVLHDACSKLGLRWRLPMPGSCSSNLVCPELKLGSCAMPACNFDY